MERDGQGSACITLGSGGAYSTLDKCSENCVGGKGWQTGTNTRIVGYNADTSTKVEIPIWHCMAGPLIHWLNITLWKTGVLGDPREPHQLEPLPQMEVLMTYIGLRE